METWPPVEGQFGRGFPAICNHCGVMTAWSRKTLKFCDNFCFFLEKRSFMVKFSKLCSEMATPIDVVAFICRKICPTGNRWNRALLVWQKIASLSNYRYCADLAQNLPGPAPNISLTLFQIYPNRFTFGGVIAERVNTVLLPRIHGICNIRLRANKKYYIHTSFMRLRIVARTKRRTQLAWLWCNRCQCIKHKMQITQER